MWKTALFLILGLVVVPVIAFQVDEPLNDLQTQTLETLVYIYLSAAGLCFVISTLTKNYSQVDKLWSVIPVVYAWVVAEASGFEGRIVLMAILVSIWGIRLTYNFGRRGGYSLKFWEGEEDYRWSILQAKPEFQSAINWSLFNLFFISLYQMGLILLFTLPILKAMGGPELTFWDGMLSAAFIAFVVIETIADQQQWTFQTEKYRRINAGEPLTHPYDKGFVQSGFWGIVRHPNYAAEQAIWMVFYLFSIVATGIVINWSIAGCILLVLLFKGSSDFSENISSDKYPDYTKYQEQVPRFLPLKWKK
jgi:steroid 5-alpha reductase family enzyme